MFNRNIVEVTKEDLLISNDESTQSTLEESLAAHDPFEDVAVMHYGWYLAAREKDPNRQASRVKFKSVLMFTGT